MIEHIRTCLLYTSNWLLDGLRHTHPQINQRALVGLVITLHPVSYTHLSKRIEQLMNNAEDENDPCVPVELMAEFVVLQAELYQKALKKNKEESN